MNFLTLMANVNRRHSPVWAPEGEDGAGTPPPDGEGTPPAGGEGSPPAGGGEGDTPPAGGGAGDDDGKSWYDSREWSDPTLKDHLIKTGYHKVSAEEALEKALKGELTATAKLGKNPSSLMDKPSDPTKVADWLKENGDTFGLPKTAEEYDLKLPEDLPKGLPIDDAMLKNYQVAALEAGLPPALAQANVDFYAKHMTETFSKLSGNMAEAETALNTELKEAWGGNWKDNEQMAVRTFQALAAQAGLSEEQTQLAASKTNDLLGDGVLLKFFHGLRELVSEDTLKIPKGGNAVQMQIDDAKQRKAAIMEKHTGEMAKATRSSDQRRINQLRDELKSLNSVLNADA